MGTISIEHGDRLFWLGRYTERAYTTIKALEKLYDRGIDGTGEEYREYLMSFGMDDVYGNEKEFFRSFIFDEENPSSVAASLVKAYDNGIVLREEISTEALSFLQMAMDKLEHTKHSSQALCLSLLPLIDILYGFWGCVGEYVYDEEIKTIIECGKYVERLDLYLRLKYPFPLIEREFTRLCASLRNVPKNTPYRYNTNQLCVLVEVMGMGEKYTESKSEALSALGRLFEPVRRSVMAG
ncbi:MAG: alpha-E domain-containing protein [Oscillospiraceae bacterium]